MGLARRLAIPALVLGLAALARLGPWSTAFTPDGVLLAADGDTYYHALRAEGIARDWPQVPWFDPGMNHPYGAAIPWPPLLDQVIATGARATGPATSEHVAAVAAVVPALAGVLAVALVAALGAALLGGAAWWDAALVAALLPASLRLGFVGRSDHHVLEILLSSLAYLAYLRGLARGGWRWPALLGAALALAFWNWAGSPMYLLLLAGHVALLHLLLPAGDPRPGRAAMLLARGAGVAAVLLALSVAAWGPPGAWSLKLTPITGLSAVVSAATAAGALAVAWARRAFPAAGTGARAATLGAGLLALLLAAALLPAPLAAGVGQGLGALSAGSAWYAGIPETWPLVFSGRQPWDEELLRAARDLGFTLLLVPVAAWLLVRAWRAHPEQREALAFLALWGGGATALAVMQRRFGGYATVPLALACAWAVRELAARLAQRADGPAWLPAGARVGGLLAVLLPGLPLALRGEVAELPDGAHDKIPLLDLLRTLPSAQGFEGVLSTWQHGHEIRWFARKPVVSTPFGTDIDLRSLQGEAAFLYAADPGAAEALLRERGVGYLLLENPVREVATLAPFVPGRTPLVIEERSHADGTRYALREEFFDLVAARLFFLDGGAQRPGTGGLAAYRLLAESPTPVEVLGLRVQRYKLFGRVPGATLAVRGVAPGAVVSVAVAVGTGAGRSFAWSAAAAASEGGEARLRVPYATGRNAMVLAGAYQVASAGRTALVTVTEAQVLAGAVVPVDLGTAASR